MSELSMEFTEGIGRDKEEAILDALSKMDVARDDVEIEVMKEESKKLFGLFGESSITVRAYRKKKADGDIVMDKESRAERILEELLRKMDSQGQVRKEVISENEITLHITDGEGGLLIGRRGETLNALEYIINLIVNNDSGNRLFIHIDTENYRSKRQTKLTKLANDAALEVRTTGVPYKIKNLNSKERKVIHMAIQDEKDIETVSCGEGFNRTIIIKKLVRDAEPQMADES